MAAPISGTTFLQPATFLLILCHVRPISSSVAKFYYKPYATKTKYDDSFSKEDLRRRDNDNAFHPEYCSPIHISALFRHGSRNPGVKDINRVQEIMENIGGHIGNSELHHLNIWKVPFTPQDAYSLTPLGHEELSGIAKRFVKKYPQLFQELDPGEVVFASSNRSRTLDSCKAFQNGLSEALDKNFKTDIKVDDEKLRFFDSCKHYVNSVESSTDASRELIKFKNAYHMQNLAEVLSARLGLKEDKHLKISDLKSLFTIAVLEEVNLGYSPWLSVFERRELQIMEYLADLKNYWKRGYGYKVNFEQACPLLQDMFGHLEEARKSHIKGQRFRKASLYFAHAETILPLMCLLGLYKPEEPPLADTFEKNIDRTFCSSKISPFSSNIALVLLHCKDKSTSVTSGEKGKYKLQLLVKELPEKFPVCNGDICDFGQVKKYYKKHAVKCDFNKICKITNRKDEHDEL